jgi:hypothetical protein
VRKASGRRCWITSSVPAGLVGVELCREGIKDLARRAADGLAPAAAVPWRSDGSSPRRHQSEGNPRWLD